MPKGEVPNLSDQEEEECLHCAIIDMVEEKIAAGDADAASLAALIAQSLVDVILRVPEEEQARADIRSNGRRVYARGAGRAWS